MSGKEPEPPTAPRLRTRAPAAGRAATGALTARPVAAPESGSSSAMTAATMPGSDRVRRCLAAFVAGVLIALSVPPFGWWILAPLGTAIFASLLWDRPWRSRAATGAFVGLGQFGIGIFFITEFHVVGYAALLLLGAAYQLLAGVLTPPKRMRLLG